MTSKVIGAVRRDETSLHLGGDGDNWLMTWAADDTQLTGLCDGGFLPGTPDDRLYNSHLYRIVGYPRNLHFEDVPGYPDVLIDLLTPPDTENPIARYYGFAIIAVDGVIYQFMSTFGPAVLASGETVHAFVGVKVIYSPDNGVTWHNQDGSTPVTFPKLAEQSRDNLLFFHEPKETFTLLTALQMGRDYSANTDGYVYLYSPNGVDIDTTAELAMLRVPKDRILDRSAYEYFVSRNADGTATWSSDIEQRGASHVFPDGWVNKFAHPYSWHPSIAYNEPLGLYMMTNWGMATDAEGNWFAGPTYLGIWTSPTPWGPWTQIHEEKSWAPHGRESARCYQPQISPKWIAPDGKSFWMVWTDFSSPGVDDFGEAMGEITRTSSTMAEWVYRAMPLRPGYSFNVQRVDLITE